MNKLKKWIDYRDALEIPGTNHKKKKGRKIRPFWFLDQVLILLPVGSKNC
jgi:hypothetical protein